MSKEQLLLVLRNYEETLKPIRPERADYKLRNPGHTAALGHAVFMCGEVRSLLEVGSIEKAHRWLGFLQGILWTQGIFTIDDMRAHNK